MVRTFLAKQPDDRWDGAHEVADESRWIGQTGDAATTARRRGTRVGLLAAAALAGVTVGIVGMWLGRPAAPGVSLTRLSLGVDPAAELRAEVVMTPVAARTAFAWTPDGTALVFVGRLSGRQQLYVRRLDGAEARPLANTEGAQVPAVSAGGRWVAFWAARTLRKVPLDGGPAMDLATGLGVPVGGLAWDSAGRLFIGRDDDGRIWQVAADGAVTAVTTLGDGELRHVLPWPLSGGNGILYTVRKRKFTWGAGPRPARRRRRQPPGICVRLRLRQGAHRGGFRGRVSRQRVFEARVERLRAAARLRMRLAR